MTIPLSPARGDLWESGQQGSPPVGIRGMEVETPKGVRLKLVRNGGGSTLTGCLLVEWMSADPTLFNVQRNSTLHNHSIAGVTDHVYAEKGKTIKKGSLFWIITHGPAYCISSGTGIAKGDDVSPAASGSVIDGTASALTRYAAVGVAMETQPSTAKSTLCYIRR